MKIRDIFFFILLIFFISTNLKSQSLKEDSLALVDLFNSTGGNETWINKTNWLTGRLSTWYGVSLSNNRVRVLSLKNNGLTGSMPSPFKLTALVDIYLDGNSITSIDISSLKILRYLHIERNGLIHITSNKDPNFYTGLIQLLVRGNKLKSIDITNMPRLDLIYLNNNQLEEIVKNSSPNYYPYARFLYGYNNKLTSLDVSNMPKLGRIEIHNNLLTTFDISNLKQLGAFYIYGNKLNELITNKTNGYYSSLGMLLVNSNQLTSIDISSMPNLGEIRLQHNYFHFDVLEAIQRWPKNSPRSPQANVAIYFNKTTSTFAVKVGGANNIYQWKKNGINITGATSSTLTISPSDVLANGNYQCAIINSKVSGLTLYSLTVRPSAETRDIESLDFVSKSSGNWNDHNTWEIFDGVRYFAAKSGEIPQQNNNVYIRDGNTVSLTELASCKNLNLNTSADVVRLNTGENTLDVYGKLRSYTGAVPGVNSTSAGVSNWITTGTNGKIRLKGISNRIITEKDEFSDHENLNTWTLECDLAEDVVGIIHSDFRAANVIITSGNLEVKSKSFKVSK